MTSLAEQLLGPRPDVGHWAMPSDDYTDWYIIDTLSHFGEASALDIAIDLGERGPRIAGRIANLHHRGLIEKVPSSETIGPRPHWRLNLEGRLH